MIDAAIYCSSAAGFAEISDTYDARMEGSPLQQRESLEVLAMLPEPLHVLKAVDFGCGTGRHALQLTRLGVPEVVGIDITPDMLRVAKRKARRDSLSIHWEIGDLASEDAPLPVEECTVDLGICALTLSFLPSMATAFRKMAKTLVPGGMLIVSDYHPYGLCTARAASRAKLAKDDAPYFPFTSATGEECRIRQTPYQISEIFHAARDAGLTLDAIAEPLVDHRLASTYGGILRTQIGTPLALVMRWIKRE